MGPSFRLGARGLANRYRVLRRPGFLDRAKHVLEHGQHRAVLGAIHSAFARDNTVQREHADLCRPHLDLARSFVFRDESVKSLHRHDEVEELDPLTDDQGRVQADRGYIRRPKSFQHGEELLASDIADPKIDVAGDDGCPLKGGGGQTERLQGCGGALAL